MGKKSKKSNRVLDPQVLVANEDTDEQGGTNLPKSKKSKEIFLNNSEITDNNNADSMKIKKKKRKHTSTDVANETSVQTGIIDERIRAVDDELDKSTTSEVKKKKKRKRDLNHAEELHLETTEIENVYSEIIDTESNIPKKKKKKNKGDSLTENESKDEINPVKEESVENEIIISKKKKKKNNLLNGDSVTEEISVGKVSVEEKPKVTKSQKKKKTGTAVLNEEESQVTEEDIDNFCDELDEEDNKQYEDWVKLIEASLPPLRKNK